MDRITVPIPPDATPDEEAALVADVAASFDTDDVAVDTAESEQLRLGPHLTLRGAPARWR